MGDAGVGKTETVREFAKLVGRMPVILNCGEECSLKFIYSFILGVFEAQAYGMFEDLNRISSKNLSVISTSFAEFEEKK